MAARASQIPGKKAASVVVVGSSNTDMIIRVDRVPRPGETLLGGEFSTDRKSVV